MAIQMKCRRYCIKVTGSIVAKNGSHFAQGWVACGIGSLSDHFEETEFPNKDYKFNEATNTIDGNLILDNTSRLIPYAMYEAEQGMIDFSSDAFPSIMGGITWLPGYAPAKEYYERTIAEINSLLSVDMNPIAEETYIRGLFVSVFGAFELFLRDFILCGIFNYDDCYTRASEYYHFDGSYEKLEKKIFEEINSITFHNFDKVKKLFKRFLDIDVPEHGQLSKLLKTRHDIVHRYAYTKMNGMQKIEVSRNDVLKLIRECDKFKDNLLEKVCNM